MDTILYPLLLVMSLWVVYLFNINYHLDLEAYGLRPHLKEGLIGIITMPFLHENMEHLFSNTIPLLVAGSFLVYYFKNWTWLIYAVVWIVGGTFLWFVGEEGTNHIGASGLVYGLVFFLLISGFIRGNRHLAAVALLMVFLYGSLMWGLFPEYVRMIKENISWEGHLGGAIAGGLMAIILIKKGPQNPVEAIEEDEEDTDEDKYWLEDHEKMQPEIEPEQPESDPEPMIRYRYVPKNANPWENTD